MGVPMNVASAAGRGARIASASLKLALAGYFLYLVLLRPGLPWYAYPVVAVIVFSAYRIVTREHVELRTWWVYLAGAVLFARLWFLADETGATVRFGYVIDAERLLFVRQVPALWLQQRLYVPGERGLLEWALIGVYASYFFAPHLVAVLVWRRSPPAFRVYTTAYLALLFAGLAIFARYPHRAPLDGSTAGAPRGGRADHSRDGVRLQSDVLRARLRGRAG